MKDPLVCTTSPGWAKSVAISYFKDPVDLHELKNSLRVHANCKQNLLNTFMNKKGVISIVIPFIIFVPLLRIELSYILYTCQRWKIVLAERASAYSRWEERQKLTGSFVGSRPFVNGTTSSLASSPAPADKLWFCEWIIKGRIR